MEVRNQRTAQSLLASCSPLLRSRSFGATTLPPRPMWPCPTVEKHVLGVVEEEKEKRPPFYFPSSKPVFYFLFGQQRGTKKGEPEKTCNAHVAFD